MTKQNTATSITADHCAMSGHSIDTVNTDNKRRRHKARRLVQNSGSIAATSSVQTLVYARKIDLA